MNEAWIHMFPCMANSIIEYLFLSIRLPWQPKMGQRLFFAHYCIINYLLFPLIIRQNKCGRMHAGLPSMVHGILAMKCAGLCLFLDFRGNVLYPKFTDFNVGILKTNKMLY